jgi:exosortase
VNKMQIVQQEASPRLRITDVLLAIAGWLTWLLLVFQSLREQWASNPQYAYGFLVPVLAAFAGWRRWKSRPQPEAPTPWALPVLVISALVLLPAWVIAQPTGAWRLVPWMLTLSFAGGTLAFFGLLGGRSWTRHFAFPALFLLTAVPWPGFIEAPIVQGLMKFVAEATVMVLNATGIPALQRGNLVEISSGILGIDEACSGVRSLQATLMVSLFLGELHRLKLGARVGLVAAGFATALLTNIGRTWLLAHTAASQGIGAVGKFHDPAGYTIFTICLVVTAVIAELLRRRHAIPAATPSENPANPLPRLLGPALCIWAVLVFAGTELWYRPSRASNSDIWTIHTPADVKPAPVSGAAQSLLACDRQQSAVWRDGHGAQWTMFFFEWVPGTGRSAILARVHRPEICLPGVGLRETGPRGMLAAEANGFQLTFESLQFQDSRGDFVFVFFCPWEFAPGTIGRSVSFSSSTRRDSLERVWRRERWLGQQTLELIVTGYRSRGEAEAALQHELANLIQRKDQASTVPK